MKRIMALLLAALLLCGCSPVEILESRPTGPLFPKPGPTEPSVTLPPETEAAAFLPYTLRLHAAVPIFESPTYDALAVRIVETDGVYTIVEEAADAEGNRWGRLKSGAGWVDLAAAEIYTPVTVAFADDRLLDSGAYHSFTVEQSEYLTRIAFRAREHVTDVQVSLLEPDPEDWTAYLVSRVLYTCPELEPGVPLVAEVVFYGDMTAYGITCTDTAGRERCFAVIISGRNGMPELTEYTP